MFHVFRQPSCDSTGDILCFEVMTRRHDISEAGLDASWLLNFRLGAFESVIQIHLTGPELFFDFLLELNQLLLDLGVHVAIFVAQLQLMLSE